MSGDMVAEYLRWMAACPRCGGRAATTGGQALVSGRLEWSLETACPACGGLAVCGRDDTPAELRERLLADGECGPAVLEVPESGTTVVVSVMKVLRAELGLRLSDARAAVEEVRSGGFTGTMPEMARLADVLRAAGVEARAVRVGGGTPAEGRPVP
ncbi:hypothetical protein [Streptomyces lavendulocolor]|uniref:hypothetical protein n=1 Tax=Streptomyces lavendulocolor TaxID=67316 RepID=UPI003C2D4F6D